MYHLARLAARPALRFTSSPVSFSRSFQSSAPRLYADALPPRRPVGAFRGGIFGFLFGSVLAGAGVYYYILDEYRVSNNILNEDISALQGAVQRLEGYVKQVESNVALIQKK